MAEDRLDLHIVLNEDSIDLRQETFEKQPIKHRSPHRTTSHQVLSQSQTSGEREREPLRVNGLKRLANNLYFGQQSNILQKNRSQLKNKQRNRATSADPRFRRERSPVYSKEASQTQSDSQVMDSPTQYDKKKSKTQSDSKFILDRSPQVKKTMIPKPVGPFAADQSEATNCKTCLNSDIKRSPKTEDYTHKTNTDKASASFKHSTVSHIYSCDTLTPSNIEQSTMTEEMKGSPIAMDCTSLYQTAITDVNLGKNAEVEVYNATGIFLDKKQPLKSYWDDPRLIEKYSKLLKPVHIRKSKSSWTLPLATATTTCETPTTECHPVCSKCVCTNPPKEVECPYDTYEEITDSTINYDKIKTKIYNAMQSNYYLAGFFIMGSICGLMLVTLVVWVLANDIIWSYMNKQETPKLTGVKWMIAYVGGGILHGINVVFNKFYHMIVMPRNEVFDPLKVEENVWSLF